MSFINVNSCMYKSVKFTLIWWWSEF